MKMLLRKPWLLQQTMAYHRKKKAEIAERKELSSLEEAVFVNNLIMRLWGCKG
ncbi:hypothetical protein [Peribacillus simplex]|uniref:hypothetical protein n=1 Tax=Peribacillus simplex TaxID=1478 RepID=UPI003D276734